MIMSPKMKIHLKSKKGSMPPVSDCKEKEKACKISPYIYSDKEQDRPR